jgi:hypothetical protein
MFEAVVDPVPAQDVDAQFAALVDRAGGEPPVDLAAPPGPDLAGLLAAVAAEPTVLADADLVDGIAAAARLEAWAAGLRLCLVGELAGRREAEPACHGQGLRCAAAEVAAALGVSGRAGEAQVDLAVGLRGCL